MCNSDDFFLYLIKSQKMEKPLNEIILRTAKEVTMQYSVENNIKNHNSYMYVTSRRYDLKCLTTLNNIQCADDDIA